jgi:DNA-directed RNA polymerase specialized sigma24 family protein
MAKVFDEETFAEIAAGMGLAVSTVKTHYLRGLQTLREVLKSEHEVQP